MQAGKKRKQQAVRSVVAVQSLSSAITRIACFTSLTLWQKEDRNLSENTQSTETPSEQPSNGGTAIETPVKEIQVSTDNLYCVIDDVFHLYTKGDVQFVCGDVALVPRVVGCVDGQILLRFNWAD